MLYDKCYVPKYNKIYSSDKIIKYIKKNGISKSYRGYLKCPYCKVADFKVCLNVQPGRTPYLAKWPNSHHHSECYYDEIENDTTKIKNNVLKNLNSEQTEKFLSLLLELLNFKETSSDTIYIDIHNQISNSHTTNLKEDINLIERKTLRRKKITNTFFEYMKNLLLYSEEKSISIGVYGFAKIISNNSYTNKSYKYYNYKILNTNGKFIMNLGILDNEFNRETISLLNQSCDKNIRLSMIVELTLKNEKFLNAQLLRSNSIKILV